MTDKTSTAPVMSLQQVRDELRGKHISPIGGFLSDQFKSYADAIDAHLNAPTPDVVGGDVLGYLYLGKPREDGSRSMEFSREPVIGVLREFSEQISVEEIPVGRLTNCAPCLLPSAMERPHPMAFLPEHPDNYVLGWNACIEKVKELNAATRVQGDAEVNSLRECADALREMRIAFPDPDRQVYRSARDALAKLDAALAAQTKGDDLVRYCPECSSIGDVPPGARDCCPDGSAARHIPKHIAEASAQLNFIAMQRHPAEQTRGDGVSFADLEELAKAIERGGEAVRDLGPMGKLAAGVRADVAASIRALADTARTAPRQTGTDGVVILELYDEAVGELDSELNCGFDENGCREAMRERVASLREQLISKLKEPRQAVPDGVEKDAARWKFFAQCGWPVGFLGRIYDNAQDLDAAVDDAIAAAPSAGRVGVDRG